MPLFDLLECQRYGVAKRRIMPLKKRAVTLTEIVVSTVILSAVFAGMFASFLSVRKIIARSTKRLVGFNIGRSLANRFWPCTDADAWDTDCLAVGNVAIPSSGAAYDCPVAIDGINYTCNKTVVASGTNQYRQVTVNVTYPDE